MDVVAGGDDGVDDGIIRAAFDHHGSFGHVDHDRRDTIDSSDRGLDGLLAVDAADTGNGIRVGRRCR